MNKSSIGDRMKGYEAVPKIKLQRRTPVIIRLDGKAFHTWTRWLKSYDTSLTKSPFSDIMFNTMSTTMVNLAAGIQNASFAYAQSDEISILLNDWKTFKTDQWFGATVQKMASISASMATAFFNDALKEQPAPLALFDARVFNIPKEEVANYFVWRQQDATRNSINMLAQYYFSHNELQGLNTDKVQEKLFTERDINWNDIPTWQKRGYCATSNNFDPNIPIFTQDRDYIEQHLEEGINE